MTKTIYAPLPEPVSILIHAAISMATKFCWKVEVGAARSKQTYAECLELLRLCEEAGVETGYCFDEGCPHYRTLHGHDTFAEIADKTKQTSNEEQP